MTRDYLAEYDAASEAEQFPLVKQWMATEPLTFFAQLRRERPVLVTPECTLLSRFTDIRDALQMPRIFTVALYRSKMGVTDDDPGFMMAHDDNPLHERERAIMLGFLNRDDVPRIRELVAQAARDRLQAGAGSMEMIRHYSRIVPTVLVRDYFGLDGVATDKLLDWSYWNQYNTFHNQPFNLHAPEKSQYIAEQQDRCVQEMQRYIKALLVRKLISVNTRERLIRTPLAAFNRLRRGLGFAPIRLRDDIVQRMLLTCFAENVDFPLERLGANIGGLLVGTVETTSQAVAQTVRFFLEQPDLLAQARQAAASPDPEHFDAMVWEALRFVPISPFLFRQLSQEYTIARGTDRQTTIPKGTNVLMLTQSAMFDDYCHLNPEQFIPQRNWYHHFNFGFASHDCIGKHIGRVMIPEMVRQVMRLDGLRATSAMDYQDGPFPETYHLQWTP
ncbi:cytochrome P450 [Ketobacter sp.]|uniref:cytochrome P450 n=1 Tax=Ketobacter sp. TaxID=2083498 RepID=UPI000F160FEF|nr:cytochrome P450 [Ketobacter sp.]RLT94000.1 MAG: cytochrome P450 [Ketobacter sp.]